MPAIPIIIQELLFLWSREQTMVTDNDCCARKLIVYQMINPKVILKISDCADNLIAHYDLCNLLPRVYTQPINVFALISMLHMILTYSCLLSVFECACACAQYF